MPGQSGHHVFATATSSSRLSEITDKRASLRALCLDTRLVKQIQNRLAKHRERGRGRMEEGRVCVVTGGRGFAARHLVLQLLSCERWLVVRILDLAPHISLEAHEQSGLLSQSLASGKALYVSVDLRDPSQVLQACKGVDAVFHMAAPDSSINNFDLHYNVTVQGTRNVINACIANGVGKLIYTSSPSTVFDGIHGIMNGDETIPYPDRHNDVYSETKAQAEALVLAANGKFGLVTCALRPSSIFGPGDRLLVPSLVDAARSGKMKFILGDGKNMYDFTYVENVAHAHVCAEEALDVTNCYGDNAAAGKAYFVTNKEPIEFWVFMSNILEGLGYERPKIHLPVNLLMPLACLVAWAYEHMPVFGAKPPQFTPSRLRLVSSWRTFNCDRAVKLLGYQPIFSLEDGLKRTIESFSHLRAEPIRSKDRELDGISKCHKVLGGGKVADLLLWKNEKTTLFVALTIFTLTYYFLFSSLTLLSVVSKLCFVLMAAIYIQKFLPASVFGAQRRKLASLVFEVPEDTMNMAIRSLQSVWNAAWDNLENAVAKRNLVSFGKVMLFGCVMKVLGRFSFSTVLLTGCGLLFTVFYVYDRKESEIDSFVESIKDTLSQKQAFLMERVSYIQQDRSPKKKAY